MSSDYSQYIGYIVLVAVFFLGSLGLLFFKKNKSDSKSNKNFDKKNKSVKEKEINTIQIGSISVLFDSFNNVVIIPYVKDLLGEGTAIKEIQVLDYPYTNKELGKIIRYSIELCKGGVPCSNIELMKNLGFNNWKNFSKGKKNLSVSYSLKRGLVLSPTTRMNDGAYQFNSKSTEIKDVSDINNKKLGEEVISLISRCR